MNIGILTHYDVLNQGAQLQMYALYRQLVLLGHKPYILTYEKNFDFAREEQLKNKPGLRSIPYYIRCYLMKKGIGLTVFNVMKYIKFRKFRKQNFRFNIYTHELIDVVVVGSDEVFSIPVGCNQMMFGYGIKTEHLIAYAPSFGQTNLEAIRQHGYEELMKKGLMRFHALSARDAHTAELVRKLTDVEAEIVCDPVILYDFSRSQLKFTPPNYKYIAIYSYDRHMNEPKQIKAIRRFAREKNLKLVSAGTYHKWCEVNVACNPLVWLEWIRNAEYVITDTYHGTIAAAVTGRKMAVYIRRSVNQNKLKDLIEVLGIGDRLLEEISLTCLKLVFHQEIDDKSLSRRLQMLRKTGRDYLNHALSICENELMEVTNAANNNGASR
ncbi:MAG: Polysaccharide pyruvyl transferase [Herbinix sp.]|jgi:hypothetical protein|nr:Polysaccharide pyruvyl transferase [Herbinix sp.]